MAQDRGKGAGRKLMKDLEEWAYHHGHSQAWVATRGPAVQFYQKCGWQLTETIHRTSEERMSILTKSFHPLTRCTSDG